MRVRDLAFIALAVPGSALAAGLPNGSGGWILSPEPGGDDTDSLSAALNDTAPGGVVSLTAGTFRIKRNVFVANFQGTIEGLSPEATLITADAADYAGPTDAVMRAQCDALDLPDRGLMRCDAIRLLVFTESSRDVAGQPTTPRSTAVTLRNLTIRLDGNSWKNAPTTIGGLPAPDFGLPFLVQVFGRNARWFRPEDTLSADGKDFLPGRVLSSLAIPEDPSKGRIGDLSHATVRIENVYFDGRSRTDPQAPYAAFGLNGGYTNPAAGHRGLFFNFQFKPSHFNLTVIGSRFRGFLGHAMFADSPISRHPEWNVDARWGTATAVVTDNRFEGIRRFALILGDPAAAHITFDGNVVTGGSLGPGVLGGNGRVPAAGYLRTYYPANDRVAATRVWIRGNSFDITNLPNFGPENGGYAAVVTNEAPELNDIRVAFHDNDIVLSGTAAKAALFRRLHDASIARNVVSGTSVDGIVTRGCQGASIVNNDLAGFTATGGFKILLDDASDSTVSGNDGVEAADVFDDGSGNVVDE